MSIKNQTRVDGAATRAEIRGENRSKTSARLFDNSSARRGDDASIASASVREAETGLKESCNVGAELSGRV